MFFGRLIRNNENGTTQNLIRTLNTTNDKLNTSQLLNNIVKIGLYIAVNYMTNTIPKISYFTL